MNWTTEENEATGEQVALPGLSSRQVAVLELLAAGHSKGEIAQKLRIGERSVDRLMAETAGKLSVLDPRLQGEELGTVGRAARMVALYLMHYPARVRPGTRRAAVGEPSTPTSPLFRLNVRSELDIGMDSIRNDTQVTVRCLEDEVGQTAHGIIIDDRSPKADVRPRQLEVWSHSPKVNVTHKMIVEDPKRPLFQVLFDPPLTRGEQLTYHYCAVTANYFPMSQEDVADRIAAGLYHLADPYCEKTYNVGSPTGHLYLRLTFPPLFEVEDEQVVVDVGRAGPRDHSEEARIRRTSAFGKSVFARRISLTLNVDQPPLLRRYRLRWRPSR